MNQLDATLGELRSVTGPNLAGLAAKTPYSKSSWERYLNGKTLPPREAVEELCRLAGEPEGRCVALWELAETETSGRGASKETPPPPPPAPITRIGDRIEMDVSGRASTVRGAEVRNSKEADTYVYTVMAATRPGTVVRACFQPVGGERKECFEGRVR